MAFLEEQLPITIDYGSSFSESTATEITITNGGNEYRSLRHPYMMLEHDFGYQLRLETWIIAQILDLYVRAGGRFDGFRVKNLSDFTTNNYKDSPTFSDQLAVLVSAGVYQITRWYGTEGGATAIRRRCLKLVVGTTLVGISNPSNGNIQSLNGWAVDTTTGQITFTDNQTAITGITQAASAVITVGSSHGYVADDSVYISAAVGMTEINSQRALVTAVTSTTITVDIDSTLFTGYSSGGYVNTSPQTGETVRAGCEFDIPCRFESDLSGVTYSNFETMGVSVSVIELLNP